MSGISSLKAVVELIKIGLNYHQEKYLDQKINNINIQIITGNISKETAVCKIFS